MAMNAKQAAELIRNGNFNDADELYDALNGQKEYGAEFARLLQHIETKVKLDMSLYTGLATSAKAVEELSAATDPLDEKDPAFADTRKRLEKVELYQTVSENGKEVSKAVEGKERDKMIAQIVAAAKLEADSELRGASSPESPAAKKFMNAADAEAKKAVYRETLNEKIDLALLQSFLVAETTKINREMDKKYSGDRKKADEEAKILLSARTKEIKEKIANIGKSGAEKLSIGVEGAIGYCAKVSAQAEERLAEYKNNVKKIADRINRGFAKLKDQGKTLRNQWQKARAGANKVFESCNKKMSDGIVAFNEGCKHVWENKYEIALSVAKNIYKNKYEIGADMVAAAGFAATVATGGTAALVGGAAYAAYTVGRRVIYEAYKQKKEHPDKSYKEIYTNGKFLTKAVFSVGAAAVSWGIAGTAASVGADVATQTAAEVAKQLAAQKMAKRAVTIAGSVTSNIVGVATAKDAEERKREWKSLGMSALGAAVTMFVAEACSDAHAGETRSDTLTDPHSETLEQQMDSITVQKAQTDTLNVRKTLQGENLTDAREQSDADIRVAQADNREAEVQTEQTSVVDDFEMKDFPEQWNENMGISRRQFETLKSWYDKLDTTDGAGMDRFYSHAAHYAAELSVDSDNPMTAEQVLFKFSRLAAITSVKSGEFGTIGTGSLGKQLEDIYHLLGCGDQLTAEQMETARKTLDICTLNEAGRADGRMDADKFFAVAGAGYKGLPVDEDGTLTMTRRIRVIGEGTNCPDDKRVMYEEVKGGEERKIVEPIEPQKPIPATIITEENSGSDIRLELEGDGDRGGDEVITRSVQKEEKYTVGATTQSGKRPGLEGAQAAQKLNPNSPEAQNLSRRELRQLAKMQKEIESR